MKKLTEYTPQEIALVCKDMPLRANTDNNTQWLINSHAIFNDIKDKINVYAKNNQAIGTWHYARYDYYMNKEDILACELALDEHFNKRLKKPLSRFELINE